MVQGQPLEPRGQEQTVLQGCSPTEQKDCKQICGIKLMCYNSLKNEHTVFPLLVSGKTPALIE